MVSRDFGKLEAMRHFTAGIDWATAGMATAEPAAPTAAAFRNSRRFIVGPLLWAGGPRSSGASGARKLASFAPADHHIGVLGALWQRHVADAQLDALASAPAVEAQRPGDVEV